MAEPLEMADTLARLVARLSDEWGRLDGEVTRLRSVLDRMPNGVGGQVHLPSPHRMAEAWVALGGMPTDTTRLGPACVAAQSLTEAAADWRSIATTLAPPISEGFDTVAMAKGKRGWQSLAAEQYDHFVNRYNVIAEDLATLLREAATAMERADESINGWLSGALTWALGVATALIGLIVSLSGLVSALSTWALAALDAFGVVGEAMLFEAVAAMDAAAGPVLLAVVGVVVSLIGLGLAVHQIQSDLTRLAEDAAQLILDVDRRLRDSTPWPIARTVPSQDSWATP